MNLRRSCHRGDRIDYFTFINVMDYGINVNMLTLVIKTS